jgi:hypothetical protein
MNERLADLYGESLEISIDGDSVSGDYNPRKYAELIIRDCSEWLWANEIEWTDYKEKKMFEFFGIKQSEINYYE